MDKNKYLSGKKILFLGGSTGRDQLMLALAKELKKIHDLESFFLIIGKGKDFLYKDEGIPKEKTFFIDFDDYRPLNAGSHNTPLSPDIRFVRAAEEKYDFNSWDIWQITAPRRRERLKFTSEKVLYWVEYFVRKMERIIESTKFDYFVSLGTSSFASVIICNTLKKNKIQQLDIVNARVPKRFTFNNNFEDRWPLLVKEYQELKKRDLTREETELAEGFINNFRENPCKPDDSAKVKVSTSQKVKKYLGHLKTFRYRKQLPDLRQYFWPITDRLLDLSGIFDLPKEDEKYVYYPLHKDPEASTSLYGKWYVNQLALIENISRSIPCGHKLYVKEHTFFYSSRPRYFHNWIKKFPNIRLISPHANSIELIKKSSLVLTITGTTGWEAILLQKPVITFGNIYYNIFDEVVNIKEIEKLPHILKEKLDQKTDKIKTLKFVAAVHRASFPGTGALPGDCQMRSLKPENISLLVKGMEQYLNRTIT